MIVRMTDEEKLQRVIELAEWSPAEVASLQRMCAKKGLVTTEQRLGYAQQVLDNQCLSVLRGGDPELDALVAEALRHQE